MDTSGPRIRRGNATLADVMIQLGFWTQLVLLALVNWGSLTAFARHGAPWYHVVGIVVVDASLLLASVVTFRFIMRQGGPPRGG